MPKSAPTKTKALPKHSETNQLARHYGLSRCARTLWIELRANCNEHFKRDSCWKSQRVLAHDTMYGITRVSEGLQELRDHEIITTRQKKGGRRNQQEHILTKYSKQDLDRILKSKPSVSESLDGSKPPVSESQTPSFRGSNRQFSGSKSSVSERESSQESTLNKGQNQQGDFPRPKDLLTDQQEDRFDLQQLTGPMDRPKFQKEYDKKTREDAQLALMVDRLLLLHWNPDAGKCGGGFRRLLRRWILHVNEYGTAAKWNVELRDAQQRVKDAKLLRIIRADPILNKLMGEWWITDIKTHIRGVARKEGVSKTKALKLIAEKHKHPTSQQARAAS